MVGKFWSFFGGVYKCAEFYGSTYDVVQVVHYAFHRVASCSRRKGIFATCETFNGQQNAR